MDGMLNQIIDLQAIEDQFSKLDKRVEDSIKHLDQEIDASVQKSLKLVKTFEDLEFAIKNAGSQNEFLSLIGKVETAEKAYAKQVAKTNDLLQKRYDTVEKIISKYEGLSNSSEQLAKSEKTIGEIRNRNNHPLSFEIKRHKITNYFKSLHFISFFRTFAKKSILNFKIMDTLVMDAPTQSNVRIVPNFARCTGTCAKPKTARVLDDAFFIALTKDILNGLKPKNANVRGKDLWDAVESGKISPDVVDDFEDAVFGQIMDERRNDPENGSVSREEIMKILDA